MEKFLRVPVSYIDRVKQTKKIFKRLNKPLDKMKSNF